MVVQLTEFKEIMLKHPPKEGVFFMNKQAWLKFFLSFGLIGAAVIFAHFSKLKIANIEEIALNQSSGTSLKSLPSFSFLNLLGSSLKKDDLKSESAPSIMIHFWATWCAPCEDELPELVALSKQSKEKVRILFVAVNDKKEDVVKFLTKKGWLKDPELSWVIDNSQEHKELFGTTKLPETYLFETKSEKILHKFVGPQAWLNQETQALLAEKMGTL
jgi:cytochrome c biogenesis protein CcmG/thiol:disulfide interchange protein DsbE